MSVSTTLYIQFYSQVLFDTARSTFAGILNYTATGYNAAPPVQCIYDYGASNNTSATPFPVFVNDAAARAFFDSTSQATLLSYVNTSVGSTYYTSATIDTVDAPIQADFSALATVATTGSYTDLTNTPAIPAAQVNTDWNSVSGLSQLTNKPSLATVATSGAYSDLSGKPSIPAAQVNSDWNAVTGLPQIMNRPVLAAVATSGAYSDISGRPTLATVATSGAYSDLSGKPSLATVATSGSYSDLSGKPSIPTVQAYEGTVQRSGAFPFFADATVASGVAVFQLTTNGLAAGSPIFPNGVIQDSVNVFVSDATASYQMAAAWTNSNKTLTVTTNKLTTANILTGILGQASGNGSVVKLQVWGY